MSNPIFEGFPDKLYSVIYADPPWQYNARHNPNTRFKGGAGGHYPTMPMEERIEDE